MAATKAKEVKKTKKFDYGLYAVFLALLVHVMVFIYQFKFGTSQALERLDLLFGPFPLVFAALVVIAIASIFVRYKYSWLVMSLPFLWSLLLPLTVEPSGAFRGSLINLVIALFAWNLSAAALLFLSSLLSLLCVLYLFIANLKHLKQRIFEIACAVLIVLVLILYIF